MITVYPRSCTAVAGRVQQLLQVQVGLVGGMLITRRGANRDRLLHVRQGGSDIRVRSLRCAQQPQQPRPARVAHRGEKLSARFRVTTAVAVSRLIAFSPAMVR